MKSRNPPGSCAFGGRRGMTLVEIAVVLAIIAILAAIAIPVFSGYIKDSRVSEATVNIQGILAAEQAYYSRFRIYLGQDPLTGNMIACPIFAAGPCGLFPPAGQQGLWSTLGCGQGWIDLGWVPEGPVSFRYWVFSPYHGGGIIDGTNLPAAVVTNAGNLWGINWVNEVGNNSVPWVAVEAQGDTDCDGQVVTFRGQSVTHKIYRTPNIPEDGYETW